MDFPLGWPVIPAAAVSRSWPLPADVTLLVRAGEQVRSDQPVAERPGPDGEALSIPAGLAGRITQAAPGRALTVEGVATVIQGVLGLGGPTAGQVHFLPRAESVAVVPIPRGAVIVYPSQVPLTLLQRAAALGAAGIVAASVGAREIEAFLRADLPAILDGLIPQASWLPLTLIFTEGIGSWVMDPVTFQLLAQRAGDTVWLDGATNPRLNVRPEVLLSLPPGSKAMPVPADDIIGVGARVRIVAGPQRGARGEVVHLFARRQRVAPGLLVRAARVHLEDGARPVVPLVHLDRTR